MPLSLAAPLRERLIEQLVAELNNATVFADYFISAWSLRGLAGIKSLPDKGELAEQLSRFIGDDPFSTFATDELDTGFKGPGPNTDANETPLANYEGYGDLGKVASDLVEAFATLPWSYELTIRLPNPLGAAVTRELGDTPLSPRHRIVSGATLSAAFPMAVRHQGLMGLMSNARPAPPWDEDGGYLQVSMNGYFRSKQTEPFFAARDDVLTFFGLGIALGLFDEFPSDIKEIDGKVSHLYVHRLDDGAWVEQSTLDIDDQHKYGIGRLALAEDARNDPNLMRQKLARIGSVFRSDMGKNIALSARWLFESYCGRDALLQYIQAAVAIEILLGDEEADPSVGLTTLMANRCAFLIAKTPTARENLLKLFRDIYRVRSKIVHRGKSRLNTQEIRLFRSLHFILRMVIDTEQRLLERAEVQQNT
ncbi:HEPN domain-containing protein [Luteimonas suaedae]|uniref:HEPN domain-containing protein n=1 Tax=Luteimonas suaedae TaxID=2605430 RepID=UPI0011EDD773|nr:HEPN domain-containing protein [Luteimonas suaedae]